MASIARPLRVAVEGCGHGELHSIYKSVFKSCQAKGWDGVDVLIIGGDFQACRNNHDMNWMAVPLKFRKIHDFHEYYSGRRTAPCLTLFIGGNHEASNHLQELYYGGWAAPNIYYMGAANVVNLGGVRIAGMSGIWKGYDYRKPHCHLDTLRPDDARGVYHTREIDIRKLLLLRSQIDVGLSHDWPQGIERDGNLDRLFKVKPYFRADVEANRLGSEAAKHVLGQLRPYYWFSAHLHVKYSAVVGHEPRVNGTSQPQNTDEISLDDDEDDLAEGTNGHQTLPDGFGEALSDTGVALTNTTEQTPIAAGIKNDATRFLALDKCLPKRDFLQLLEIPRGSASSPNEDTSGMSFRYDPEWLAITRVFAEDVKHSDKRKVGNANAPADRGRAHYEPLIDRELDWVNQNIVTKGKLDIPHDFQRIAPVYDPNKRFRNNDMPRIQPNQHTESFCSMLDVPNPVQAPS